MLAIFSVMLLADSLVSRHLINSTLRIIFLIPPYCELDFSCSYTESIYCLLPFAQDFSSLRAGDVVLLQIGMAADPVKS